MFTACSLFANTDDLMKKADKSFENKEFKEFNELYLKLSKADQEKADEYLREIKKHKWFTIDQSAPNGDIATIQSIGKEVPDLTDFSNKTIYSYSIYEATSELKRIINEVNRTTIGVAVSIISIDTIEELIETQDFLETSVSETNTNLVKLEDTEVPPEYQSIHDNLVVSLKDYRDKLHNQYTFILDNGERAVSSHQLALQSNLFSLSTLMNLNSEYEKIQSDLQFAGQNLTERISTIEGKIS
jgi:hypothetical protein